MIVSGIWWKRVELRLGPAAAAPLLLLLLGGCGIDQLMLSRPPAQPATPPLPPTRPSAAPTDVNAAGLSPLPTPQQVLTAVPFGRSDPFAPMPKPAPVQATASAAPAAAGSPSPLAAAATAATAGSGAGAAVPSGGQAPRAPGSRLEPPEGFRLTGVIRSGGRAEALVSFGPLSGSLRLGDRGGRSTALLPAGWALAAIQFAGNSPTDPPSITLRRGVQSVKVSL